MGKMIEFTDEEVKRILDALDIEIVRTKQILDMHALEHVTHNCSFANNKERSYKNKLKRIIKNNKALMEKIKESLK